MTLDPDRVRAAARRWIWVPVDATEVTTEEYRLTHYTDYTCVQWSLARRPVADLVEEVVEHARAAGRPRVRWWVDERTRPADTAEQLAGLGLRKDERLEVLALPVESELDELDEVEVVELTTRDEVERGLRLSAAVFGYSPPSSAQIDDHSAMVSRPVAERVSRSYLAFVDGVAAAHAGSTVDGDALRLWDGAVLPAYRGRGAYRALVARRLRDARSTTAEFALVKAVDDTSAPILRRLGFTRYGEQHCWALDL